MKLVRQFLGFLWSAARWQMVGAVLLSTLLSLTEGVSIAMIFPLIALLGGTNGANGTNGSGAVPGRHTQVVFHLLAATHLPQGAWLAAVLLLLVTAIALLAILNGLQTTVSLGMILRVRQRLAEELYRAILHADWVFLASRRSSDLTHLLTEELARVGQLTSSVTAVLSAGMVAALMLAIAFYLSPLLTLLLLAGFAVLVPLERRSSRAIHASGEAISRRTREVFESSMERLQNLKVIKAYGAQDAEMELFRGRYSASLDEMMDNEWKVSLASRRFQILSLVLLCAVILAGLGPMHLAAGTLLIFLFAFLRATPRLNTLQSKGNNILTELPAYRHILGLIAECAQHSEREQDAGDAPTLRHACRLENVVFAYSPAAPPVLNGVTLELPAGRVTAIAGLSGAGKSTVADLVMGLLLPQSGAVLVDGVPIHRGNARAWRTHIGYVSQDTLLFNASVRDNLLWARRDASGEQIANALRGASAEFVFGLSQGMDTPVGDRGIMLSHGQRQRVALARALLIEPSLLILDEATNSLDLENEEKVLDAVRRQGRGLTTLLISHRPSAIQVADFIYVLEAGRIALSGTWNQVKAAVEAQAGSTGEAAAVAARTSAGPA